MDMPPLENRSCSEPSRNSRELERNPANLLVVVITLVLFPLLIFVRSTRVQNGRRTRKYSCPEVKNSVLEDQEILSDDSASNGYAGSSQISDLDTLKQMYYQLQNLEEFSDVLPEAQKLLLSLLETTGKAARAVPADETILSIDRFSRENLDSFMTLRDRKVAAEWNDYIDRRQKGGPRELFEDLNEAKWWLRQIAPVKLVDGAWLGHINRVTLPYSLIGIIRSAWQVLSEELGDGDLKKNHVYIYSQLLESFQSRLPASYDLDFIHDRHQLNELSVWKAAVAQLLICLFPHDLLPEILGFNLHFESISLETLLATRELKEVGLDPYYFVLHVSIDNADCGHTAMAFDTVCRYIEYVKNAEGEYAAQKAWRRVQSGYLLSSALPPTTVCPSRRNKTNDLSSQCRTREREMIRIFQAKARVGHSLHCSSRCKIGRRKLFDWLDPVALESQQWQTEFLQDLSDSRYWICKGNSGKSRFVQELVWGGRMFGSFTTAECDVVKNWIDNLPPAPEILTMIASRDAVDILSSYPVFRDDSFTESRQMIEEKLESLQPLITFDALKPLIIGTRPIPGKFLPLWLSHTCLLQNFISVPFRTTNIATCAVIKILRAQAGFGIEGPCVAGMDEVRRLISSRRALGIIGLGLTLMDQWGLSEVYSLKDVLTIWPSDFTVEMLHLSMSHLKNRGLLIGMATAFYQLHGVMSRSETFSVADQILLRDISQREAEGLRICWKDLESDKLNYAKCCHGYFLARNEIAKCFSE